MTEYYIAIIGKLKILKYMDTGKQELNTLVLI